MVHPHRKERASLASRRLVLGVGHLPGGLAIASVLACMLFAAVSGSSPATVVAIGSIVIAGMVKTGYSRDLPESQNR
jgi:TRAP-type C4-dicarboxylate transport system permease large subunit